MLEFRKIQRKTDEEIGELRMQTRMKTDEVERVSNLYEENIMLVKEHKMENELLKNKIDMLKSECYKIESTAR
jgi:hypothetical protein